MTNFRTYVNVVTTPDSEVAARMTFQALRLVSDAPGKISVTMASKTVVGLTTGSELAFAPVLDSDTYYVGNWSLHRSRGHIEGLLAGGLLQRDGRHLVLAPDGQAELDKLSLMLAA